MARVTDRTRGVWRAAGLVAAVLGLLLLGWLLVWGFAIAWLTVVGWVIDKDLHLTWKSGIGLVLLWLMLWCWARVGR